MQAKIVAAGFDLDFITLIFPKTQTIFFGCPVIYEDDIFIFAFLKGPAQQEHRFGAGEAPGVYLFHSDRSFP